MTALPAVRSVLAMGALVCLLVACGGRAVPADADPGPTADAQLIGIDEVSRIVGDPALHFEQRGDRDRPGRLDPDAPGTCWAVSNEEAVFGSAVTRFRAVQYGAPMTVRPGGKGFPTVTQAVGRYRDDAAARGAFDRLGPALHDCAGMRADSYDFTLTQDDPATVVLAFPGPAQATVIYRVAAAELIRVSALALEQSDRIARTVAQQLTASNR